MLEARRPLSGGDSAPAAARRAWARTRAAADLAERAVIIDGGGRVCGSAERVDHAPTPPEKLPSWERVCGGCATLDGLGVRERGVT